MVGACSYPWWALALAPALLCAATATTDDGNKPRIHSTANDLLVWARARDEILAIPLPTPGRPSISRSHHACPLSPRPLPLRLTSGMLQITTPNDLVFELGTGNVSRTPTSPQPKPR